ncbi:MAG: hypothetical protein NZZ41_00115 [Candidatus Dojkabacteria bacterium]|nr:hypothetical protein [Candidatus Dojkabacteria bacterium]
MNNILKTIYSSSQKNVSQNNKQPINPLFDFEKRSLNQISGLKLSSKHQYIIEHNGELLYLANSGYVSLLEKRLREQSREIKNLQKKVNSLEKKEKKLIDKINELVTEVNKIKTEKMNF